MTWTLLSLRHWKLAGRRKERKEYAWGSQRLFQPYACYCLRDSSPVGVWRSCSFVLHLDAVRQDREYPALIHEAHQVTNRGHLWSSTSDPPPAPSNLSATYGDRICLQKVIFRDLEPDLRSEFPHRSCNRTPPPHPPEAKFNRSLWATSL